VIPIRSTARQRRAGSPVGSAAATSSSRWASLGKASRRFRKLSSILPCRDSAPGNPKPPANRAALSPRGSSNNANGFPPVSARSWSAIRLSNRPGITDANSARASASPSSPTTSSGRTASRSLGSRAANNITAGSASILRATNTNACADARSNHWASSITHKSGRFCAASDNRPSTASATKMRSGTAPALNPNVVASALRWGPGRPSRRSSTGAHN
jgi:hypothetical protein